MMILKWIYKAVRCSLVSKMSLSRRSSTDSLLLLVAQLQLQDVQTLTDARKDQVWPPADDEFAITLQEALLAADMQVMRDRRLAQSLERAGGLYGEALDGVVEDAMRVVHDHERHSRVGSQSSSEQNSGINSGVQSPVHAGFERSVYAWGKLLGPPDHYDL